MTHSNDKWNVRELVKSELRGHVRNALDVLYSHNFSNEDDFYINIAHASPQEMRGWLLHHFPTDYKAGAQPDGSEGGHKKNRGIEYIS